MKRYFIFDLDQTVVNTDAVAVLRQSKQWRDVIANVDKTVLYPEAAETIKTLIALGHKVGICTASPRSVAEAVLAHHKITPTVLVAYDDCSVEGKIKTKPDAYPIRYTLAKLIRLNNTVKSNELAGYVSGYLSQAVVIGDKWSDVAAGQSAMIDTAAAMWGAGDATEMQASGATFMLEKFSDILSLLDSTKSKQIRTESEEIYKTNLWKTRTTHSRGHLRDGRTYVYARNRWRSPRPQDNWTVSHANNLVGTFKQKITKHHWAKHFKGKAVDRFAEELNILLPLGAYYTFIDGSKTPGHEDYDVRWEMLQTRLSTIRPDLHYVQPISRISSAPAVHECECSGNNRDPDVISVNLAWNGLDVKINKLWIIDDVITSGGHIESYLRLIDENAAELEVTPVFWAEHISSLREYIG